MRTGPSGEEPADKPRVNVLCIKWGTKYGSDYVNRLYRMVGRHLRRPFRFVCLTDEPERIDPAV